MGKLGKVQKLQKTTVPLMQLESGDEKLQHFVSTQPGAIISATRMTTSAGSATVEGSKK